MPTQGKFIVIYGINNLGKSTQAKMLVERIEGANKRAMHIKYPLYELEPSGPLINEYLRKQNPYSLSPREAQMLYAFNRTHFESTLKAYLAEGINVVAEDYTGTGLAWGKGAGVDGEFLTRMNCQLLHEDVAFLIDGNRFTESKEAGHAHESDDDLTTRVRVVHLELAKEFGWHVINANNSREEIRSAIWHIVAPLVS